jgi:hypothetical protein
MRASSLRKCFLFAAVPSLVLAAACGSAPTADSESTASAVSSASAGSIAVAPIRGGAAAPAGVTITNHGGNVMSAPINLYYIWYGDRPHHPHRLRA